MKMKIAVFFCVLFFALTGCKEAASEEMNSLQVKSQDDAVRIALQELKTTTNPLIDSVKLITKDGKQVWEVALRERTGLKLGNKVLIDASSGKVEDIISEVNPAAFDEAKAAAFVLKDHPDFPKPGDVKKIETTAVGPRPAKVSGELITTVENFTQKDAEVVSVDLASYVVTLTKKWNITVNGKESKSIWKYKVTSDGKVELISSEENADIIATIK